MRTPLSSSIIYMVLGVVFTFFAIQQVQLNDWNFFAYVLILLATMDFGAGFRLLAIHFRLKKEQRK